MIASLWFALGLGGCFTPIARSAFDGDRDRVSNYLEHNSPNERFDVGGCDSCTLLHHAASGGQVEVARMLLEKGASLNVTNSAGLTPLHLACLARKVEMVKLLVAHEASLAVRDQYGNTPLIYAIIPIEAKWSWWNGYQEAGPEPGPNEEIVKLLIGAGADLKIVTHKGNTPLHMAAYKGYVNVVVLLLAAGADREARNAGGETPAMLAARYNQRTVVQILNAPPATAAPAAAPPPQ